MNYPKKVLFLVSSLSLGGAEKHVLSLAKGLLSSHEFSPMIATFSSQGDFYNQAIESGIPVIILERASRYDLFIALKIRKVLKKHNITILHTHMFYSNMIGRLSGIFLKSVAIISTEHGQSVWKNKFLVLLDRYTQFLVDKIITVSNVSKSIRLKREKIDSSRILTIHNFVSLNEFSFNNVYSQKLKEKYRLNDSLVIGMLTRLNENKRVQDAIYAMKNIVEKFPNSKLVIIGDGPLKNELIHLTKTYDLSQHILFTGFQQNTAEWLSTFDIFISISRREDFPISVLEAMSMAKPVIATKVGGIPEVVNEQTGILIPPDSPSILADKIVWLFEHPQIMKRMGLYGREIIRNKFSQDVIIPQIISVYNECLKRKKRA